jgi:hypothetical protein
LTVPQNNILCPTWQALAHRAFSGDDIILPSYLGLDDP